MDERKMESNQTKTTGKFDIIIVLFAVICVALIVMDTTKNISGEMNQSKQDGSLPIMQKTEAIDIDETAKEQQHPDSR